MVEKFISNMKIRSLPEFQFSSHCFKDLLQKTTQNHRENLWKHIITWDMDLSIFDGEDIDMDSPLESLHNPLLVYSLMMHFLGRSIFCSKQIMERFRLFLRRRLMDAYKDLEKTDEALVNKYFNKKKIDDIIASHIRFPSDLLKWYNEKLTAEEYVEELAARELLMSKLRDKCHFNDLGDSADLFNDFLAYLHLDNYCYSTLKNAKGFKLWNHLCERSILWMFPLKSDVRVVQRREIYGNRTDTVMNRSKRAYQKIEYKMIDKYLDPYAHGGHMKALYTNEPHELEYYINKHPCKQMICESYFLMMGVETQKCPAALIYNMMLFDMVDGDKISHREIFYSTDPPHSPEKGNGGVGPYTFDEAATASRYLNLYYSHLFNHWYSYDLNDETTEQVFENLMNPNSVYNRVRGNKIRFAEMMQREFDLVNRWINFKKERDRKSRYLKTIQELYNYILVKTIDFYEMFKCPLK